MTQQFLAAIGAVTIEFATLEHQLHLGIWVMLVGNTRLNEQLTAQIVTAGLSFKQSVDLFSALVRRRFPAADGPDLQTLAVRVRQAEEKRNLVVHSTWIQAEREHVIRMKTTARGELQVRSQEMTVADLEDIARQVHTAAEDVLNFCLKLIFPDHSRATL
jgi:hypothetical protein